MIKKNTLVLIIKFIYLIVIFILLYGGGLLGLKIK